MKGAYWDTEIKLAQVQGLSGYPVFTRKSHTDVSYLACARLLLDASPNLVPQFATHNAHTIAAVVEYAGSNSFEFQRLHGMGQGLYDKLLDENEHLSCRVYAPVGGHAELLPYLVRRLLENGANTSFVNRISHSEIPVEDVVRRPDSPYRHSGTITAPKDSATEPDFRPREKKLVRDKLWAIRSLLKNWSPTSNVRSSRTFFLPR